MKAISTANRNKTQQPPTNGIATVPLAKLEPPKRNPRKRIDGEGLKGLATSIAKDGVLQSLVVTKHGKDSYRIVSGERRYRALSLLRERGEVGHDYPVPVMVREDKPSEKDRLRIATVENVQRENLAPLDEAEAFAGLVTNGTTVEDIAAQTGVSVTTVKRRLSIADLCTEAKQALREGRIGLAMAEALTLGSQEAQREILAKTEDSQCDAADIRHLLTGERPAKSLAVFPLERYTGTNTEDLFGDPDTSYFDDVEQFRTLQDEAVAELVAEYQRSATWLEICGDYHCSLWRFGRAKEGEPSGVVIHYTPAAKVEVHTGLVRKETTPDARDVAAQSAAPKEKAEYSKTAIRYMAAHKSLAVMTELLADPRKAKEVAVVQMVAHRGFNPGRLKPEPHPALRYFTGDVPPKALLALEEAATPLLKALGLTPDDALSTATGLLSGEHDPLTLYEVVKSLDDERLDSLLRVLTILTFGQDRTDEIDCGDSLFCAVARDLRVAMRDWWTPDEAFLSTRRKDQLIAAAHASGASQAVGPDNRKSDLVRKLAAHFATPPENQEGERKARTWLPDAMRFDAPVGKADPQE